MTSRSRSTRTRLTSLKNIETLKRLDTYNLLLIEQPLADDDIIDHARLQSALETAICLDESIHSVEDARKALENWCLPFDQRQSQSRRRTSRGKRLNPRPLLRSKDTRMVRRHARVRHWPRGERGARELAGVHPCRGTCRGRTSIMPRTSLIRRSWPSGERCACPTVRGSDIIRRSASSAVRPCGASDPPVVSLTIVATPSPGDPAENR